MVMLGLFCGHNMSSDHGITDSDLPDLKVANHKPQTHPASVARHLSEFEGLPYFSHCFININFLEYFVQHVMG